LKYSIIALNLGEKVDSTTIPHIYFSQYGNKYIEEIDIHKQKKLANYLDQQCAHIDTVIEQTKASIEEYRKLKQSVITQAVTKGVRGERPMKDSGIEWIGDTPAEWKLIPFRHVLKERNEKNSPVKSTERLSLSIDLGVTLYSEKTTNLDRFKDEFEEYKLAHEGDLVMNSMNMIVGASGQSDYFGCVSPVYYTFYDEESDHITAKWCEYIFRSKTMLRVLFSLGKGIYAIVRGDDRVNTCRLKVAKEDLKSIIIPIPPVDEQREIIKYLNEKCTAIDNLISKKEQFLTELENYKKSLIYEYVTGKKEVP
jgi:type I restriction enzyme S subunit